MNSGYIIPSLQRGILILEAILANEDGMTSVELEERFSIPKTTIFRILQTLQSEDWVEKQGERYKVGHRFITNSMEALSGMELRNLAQPYLKQLSEETGETSHLGIWAGRKVMLAEVCDGARHIRVTNRAGSLNSAHCSSVGKVLLANTIGSTEVEEFYAGETLEKKTDLTITDPTELAVELEKVLKQGYAVDDREFHDNVRCLAAPVRNSFGSVIAAIGITATTLTFTEEMIPEIAEKVVGIADELSHVLGVH